MKFNLPRVPAKKNQHYSHKWEKSKGAVVSYPKKLRQKIDAMPKDVDYQLKFMPKEFLDDLYEIFHFGET